MREAKPLGRRIIVFHVPIRRKTLGGIYTGNPRRGAYSRVEDVWIVSLGGEVREKLKPGQKAYLEDAFELDETNLDLWDQFKENERFTGLRDFVEEVDGEVYTKIVHETSILAVDEATEEGEEPPSDALIQPNRLISEELYNDKEIDSF
jgi:hypothetical protein